MEVVIDVVFKEWIYDLYVVFMEFCEEDLFIKVWKDDVYNEFYICFFGEV